MRMAFPAWLLAKPHAVDSTTLFKSPVTPKKVAVKEFAFYLGRAASGTGQESELTLGGRDFSGWSFGIQSPGKATGKYYETQSS